MGVNEVVHHRLSHRRIIAFVVPAATVTDQVNDDVLVELLLETVSQTGHPRDHLRIVSVHVENRHLQTFSQISAVVCGTGIGRRSRETNLVIHDDVHRPAGGVGLELAHVQRLINYALTDESCVAVNQHGKVTVVTLDTDFILLSSDNAFNHRVHSFQVRGISRDIDAGGLAFVRLVDGLGAHVILHVPGALNRTGIHVAFKFGKDLVISFTGHVHQHVQPATVGHPNGHPSQAIMSGIVHNPQHQGD